MKDTRSTTLLLFLVFIGVVVSQDYCDWTCDEINTARTNWHAVNICTLNPQQTVPNNMCYFYGGMWPGPTGTVRCKEWGARYPGSCGCPNDCYANLGYGKCENDKCVCKAGRAGADCSSVACPSSCSSHGQCVTVNGIPSCQCSRGAYYMADCSSSAVSIPRIPQIFPNNQYVDDDYGDNHPLYNSSLISQIRINISQADLEILLDPTNAQGDIYYPTDFWFFNSITSFAVPVTGFRIKGASSRDFLKKSWKISFNEFEKGRKFFSLKKMQLKAMVLDPACIRDFVYNSWLYSLGVRTARQGYVMLYVNDINFGLYFNHEVIDDRFFKSRFGNDEGPLYKADGNAYLAYIGDNPEEYKTSSGFKADTESAESFEALAKLIIALNNDPENLENIFDIDSFLKALVMEIAAGNQDGYCNGKNYFLYQEETSGKFFFVPHDIDLSLGNVPAVPLTATRTVYTWCDQPLITKVLGVSKYRQRFTELFWQLLDYYKPATMTAQLEALRVLLLPGVAQDNFHIIDRGYDLRMFNASFFETVGYPSTASNSNQLVYAITPIVEFMQSQAATARTQLDPR